MAGLLSVQTVLVRIFGYPLSLIELAGTLLYIWSVWLVSRRHMLTWPVGIASVILYMAIFYQLRLYSDTLEQVYYLGASLYGWWHWSKSESTRHVISDVSFSPPRALAAGLAVTALLSIALGEVMRRVHLWAPAFFPEAASYPRLDAWTTVMSFTAMLLLARKRIESWAYWVVVDVIGIWLYWVKNVRFISLLYVVLLILAIRGLLSWRSCGARGESE